MNMLKQIEHGSTLELHFDRPPVNAINGSFTTALRDAIEGASDAGHEAVVLSGREGLFSAGLDLPELLTLDESAMREFWQNFYGLMGTIAKSPVPVAAAMTGHSPAGGTVIALFCDYRVMARGNFKLGLNEVQVGLIVPPVIRQALTRLTGAHRAERLTVAGALLSPDEALAAGMIDELSAPDHTVQQAISWCQKHTSLPAIAMRETRRLAREDLVGYFANQADADGDAFMAHWFHPDTQAVLTGVVKRLKG